MSSRKTGVLLVVVLSASCGRQIVEFKADAGDPGSGGAPTVISTVPDDGATAVARDTAISATFSETMNPATITMATFTVRQGTTTVTGTVALDAPRRTATFSPNASLEPTLIYTATITTGATNPAGRSLAAAYTWSFTTGAAFLATPPRVIFTNPADLATNVSINKRPTATFSRPMDPATITDLSFTLSEGATSLSGAVTYDASTNTAMFSPAVPFELTTVYTAVVTPGARDDGGHALVGSHMWTFRTGGCSEGPVDLGSAGNFSALAGSAVSNTGLTSIVGDLGVSPSAAITGFPPGVVVGTQHANDPTAATAQADLTTAYTEVASRTFCASTVSDNIGDLTLTPGLYASTSSLAISMGDLTLDAQGDGDAMFIFTMTSTLTTTTGRKVILTNGAKAANIFWRVGSSATLGTNSEFSGTIMADQSITLLTGATLNGRALARTGGVDLDTNMIVTPAP